MNKDDLSDILGARAKNCINLANGRLDVGSFYLAGSAIASNKIRDIDIYPVEGEEFRIPISATVLSQTKNTVTIKNEPNLQFCKYIKPSLTALIESFDFSHIQAGVKIKSGEIREVKWTDAFLYSRAAQTGTFTGSDFPLASLVRLLKYYKRDDISEHSGVSCALKIVSAIVVRGFKDYEDFKDQLDAVDLGLIPEELDELDIDSLLALFDCLSKAR